MTLQFYYLGINEDDAKLSYRLGIQFLWDWIEIINTLLKNQDLILVTYLLVYMNDFAVWVTKKRFHQSKDIGRTP